MHPRQLVEVAAMTAAHGPVFIRSTGHVSLSGMEAYWTSAKCRLDRWLRTIRTNGEELRTAREIDRPFLWLELRPVIEEILTGEILTRIWTAVTTQYDQLRGVQEFGPLTRSVYVGHMEARSRALNFLVECDGSGVEEAVEMNRLRRRCERWTDMLLGRLLIDFDVAEFAFDERRARDFSADLCLNEDSLEHPAMWQLVVASIRVGFQHGLSEITANPDLNLRIGNSILASYQAELFDSTGLIKSRWLERLCNAASDTQGLVDLLISEEELQSIKPPERCDLPKKFRRF